MVTSEDDARASETSAEVERGVTNHPLADAGAERESSTVVSASSSYAAELVQSAAKSVLDASTSLVSDDETCIDRQSSSPMAALRSLETETLPALPDEQDRKRFIVRQIK